MAPHVTRQFVLVIVASLTGWLGCDRSGFETTDLQGEIWVDGVAAPKGAITFSPLESKHGRGVSVPVEEGAYQAKQVAIGPTRVTFMLVKETGRMMDSWGKQVPEIVEIVPPKYIQGIDVDVRPGESTKDFKLDSK